jgi:hypothetical protein
MRPPAFVGVNGLCIPVRDPQGRIVGIRIRVEHNGEKSYLWASGPKDAAAGAKAEPACHVPLHDPSLRNGEVRITEGEFKADIATRRTRCLTVSVPGVQLWSTARDRLGDLGARIVRIAFDNDARTKPAVADALHDLAEACIDIGLKVLIETWPAPAKGIDDFLTSMAADRGEIVVHDGVAALDAIDDIVRAAGSTPSERMTARRDFARSAAKIREGTLSPLSPEFVATAAALFEAGADVDRAALNVLIREQKVDRAVWRTAMRTARSAHAAARVRETPPETDEGRPIIVVTTEEHAVVDEVCANLFSSSSGLYSRGGAIVRVLEPARGGSDEGPVIQRVPRPILREVVTRIVDLRSREFVSVNGVPTVRFVQRHPTLWLVEALDLRGAWSGLDPLVGLASAPFFRRDFTLVTTPGYDSASGIYLQRTGMEISVPERPTEQDLELSKTIFEDLLWDFPFEQPADRAAWLAALLAVFARPAIDGPVPLVAIEGNMRGTGKSKLSDILGLITTGRPIDKQPYSEDPNETKKTITSIAATGIPVVLFDNANGPVGAPTLDLAITASSIQDRRFGRNDEVMRFSMRTVWLVNGNNMVYQGDLVRRVLPCRLQSKVEHPEHRAVFRHPHILSHVRDHRADYVRAALVILQHFFAAGRPSQGLRSWGSFESFSEIVRQALVFAGYPDPINTRDGLEDTPRDVLSGLLGGIREIWKENEPFTVNELLAAVDSTRYAEAETLVSALEDLAGRPIFQFVGGVRQLTVNPQLITKRLDPLRERPAGGLLLQKLPRTKKGVTWRVVPVSAEDASVGVPTPEPAGAHSGSMKTTESPGSDGVGAVAPAFEFDVSDDTKDGAQ